MCKHFCNRLQQGSSAMHNNKVVHATILMVIFDCLGIRSNPPPLHVRKKRFPYLFHASKVLSEPHWLRRQLHVSAVLATDGNTHHAWCSQARHVGNVGAGRPPGRFHFSQACGSATRVL
jgi:hypothetical protein